MGFYFHWEANQSNTHTHTHTHNIYDCKKCEESKMI